MFFHVPSSHQLKFSFLEGEKSAVTRKKMKENKKEKHQKTMWMARKRRKEEAEERFVKNLKGSVANFVFFWISNLLIFECGKALNFVQFLNKLTVTYVFCFVPYIYFSLLLNKRSTSTYVWCMQMWIIWNALYEVSRSVKKIECRILQQFIPKSIYSRTCYASNMILCQ